MAVPLRQTIRVGAYVLGRHLRGVRRYPLVLMLEPLFRCNLACAGCGKIDYPDAILNQRLSVDECLDAVDRMRRPGRGSSPAASRCCTATSMRSPRVSSARKKFVYLCTNALAPREEDRPVQAQPVFRLDSPSRRRSRRSRPLGVPGRRLRSGRRRDQISQGRAAFACNINATLFDTAEPDRIARFFDAVTEIGIDGITVSPGYAYERAPDQQHFLNRRRTKELFREHLCARCCGGWSFNQSGLFLDFLAGNQIIPLHALGQPDTELFRLAAALLSARRRLCEDLQGADGRDRLGRLRHRELREVRRLHGAQRLRGDRGNGLRSAIL